MGEKSEDRDMNGAEEGSGKSQPPKPVGFWDPSMKTVRKGVIKRWLLTTVVLMAFILSALSIYWGALFHADKNIASLVIYVVDFDGIAPYNTGNPPIVGPTIVQTAMKQLQNPSHLGWGSLPASDFNNDPMQVRQAVYDFKAWAAIIINPNATSMLYSAIQNGNASYDPLGACQLIYMDSRDDTNWYDFIGPLVNMFMTQASAQVQETWAKTALQRAAANPTILQNLQTVPQAISPAIGFSQFNLRPLYPYTNLIILSFFSFSFYLPIHMKYIKPQGHPPLHFYQLIIWRWLATVTAYFFLSLAYSFVSLAFQINFAGYPSPLPQTEASQIELSNPSAYGHGTFPVYWALNFVGMCALGLANENMAMFIGNPWTGLWLIFWVISNVSTAFYDIDIEPHFYYYGYAFPLHSVVEGSRQILFDLHSRIGLDFGILFAWAAVNTTVFPFACYFMRWKSNHDKSEYWA
ncbi:MNNG and nitrosoguanidine resistance protein [Microthyrium microscopicum]|uniref:MNNG and nitrosoguanidine resistance protein n=1 Tax=Microthyrium microscopicum TaxID=703497 RepID=A0A6A6TYJ0_9PEZI|nr:MNNG and nitrosoguanidine resistance protein [Microthyrium microscopicum]